MPEHDLLFRHRFWIFAVIFWAGFALYGIDRVNAGVALLHLVDPALDPGSAAGERALRAIFGTAAVFVVLAAALRTWATAYLRTDVVHDTRLHADTLVASGPYRYVRNPLYLGGLLLAIGFGLVASRAGFIVIVGGVLVLEFALIQTEERLLAHANPVSFEAYRRAVPRLLPAPTARVPAAVGIEPRWGQALLGESFFWIFAVGAVAWVVTLNPVWVMRVGVVGVLSHLVIVGIVRGRRRPQDTVAH